MGEYNPLKRTSGLKMLSYIPGEEVQYILLQGISTSSQSSNVYARLCALIALYKTIQLNKGEGTLTSDLMTSIRKLYSNFLGDKHWFVYGPAIGLLGDIFPVEEGIQLLHPVYLEVCNNLHRICPFYIPNVCSVLTQYALTYLVAPSTDTAKEHLNKLISSASSLLSVYIRPSSTLALTSLIYNITPWDLLISTEGAVMIFPLIRLLEMEMEIRYLALVQIEHLARTLPSLWVDYLHYFRLKSADSLACKRKKLEILVHLAEEHNFKFIQEEINFWIK